ncbi:site-specific integrase [Rhizobium leguminosarum]|uniref:site-specific integrase n=1 Tax=Rhizobium leguminosarum TaxID=384 RepID=UPI001AE117B3|nr:site-specific integrase [Rhizobium leguminosarum]MBP2443436.1 hypothetical protein [Rhizobium leguminosarum]
MFGRHIHFFQFNPLHHIVVKQRYGLGALTIPALWLEHGQTLRLFQPLLDLCVARSAYSYTTLRKPVVACGLLMDYAIQRQRELNADDIGNWHWLQRSFLNEFCVHLYRGTANSDDPAVRDLDWRGGCSPDALLGLGWGLDTFFGFLGDALIEGRYIDNPNPQEIVTDLLFANIATKNRSREFSFLSHLTKSTGTVNSRDATGKGIFPKRSASEPFQESVKRFRIDMLKPLLTIAFLKNPKASSASSREDLVGQLSAALAFGAQRSSETLNFWVEDVEPKGDKVAGFLRHPQFFKADSLGPNRQEILLRDFGLTPRNLLRDRFEAGWKNPLLNSQFWARITWMPMPGFQSYLAKLLLRYLVEYRRPIMAQRRGKGLPDHPYLLVTRQHRPTLGINIGDPYTRAAMRESWRRALSRLARRFPDEDLRFGKHEGTTPHAVRHAAGHVFSELGASPKDLQRLLHHVSILSQRMYNQSTDEEVHEKFERFGNLNGVQLREIFGADDASFDEPMFMR